MVGWAGLEGLQPSMRDKGLVALAGVAPDLDGLGIVVDFATRTLGMPETNYYQEFHRIYGHGLPAAIVFAALAGALARRRAWTAAWAFVAVHLHFLCDVLGSRGASAEDIWGIYYFAPFSLAHEIAWQGQWELVSWQNTAVSAALLLVIMVRAAVLGYSPVELASKRADAVFVATLRDWKRRLKRMSGAK